MYDSGCADWERECEGLRSAGDGTVTTSTCHSSSDTGLEMTLWPVCRAARVGLRRAAREREAYAADASLPVPMRVPRLGAAPLDVVVAVAAVCASETRLSWSAGRGRKRRRLTAGEAMHPPWERAGGGGGPKRLSTSVSTRAMPTARVAPPNEMSGG
jgi:hypothetical protein